MRAKRTAPDVAVNPDDAERMLRRRALEREESRLLTG